MTAVSQNTTVGTNARGINATGSNVTTGITTNATTPEPATNATGGGLFLAISTIATMIFHTRETTTTNECENDTMTATTTTGNETSMTEKTTTFGNSIRIMMPQIITRDGNATAGLCNMIDMGNDTNATTTREINSCLRYIVSICAICRLASTW